jgi:hypothetical protein
MKQTQAREKTEETVRELTVQESLAISGGIFPNPKRIRLRARIRSILAPVFPAERKRQGTSGNIKSPAVRPGFLIPPRDPFSGEGKGEEGRVRVMISRYAFRRSLL